MADTSPLGLLDRLSKGPIIGDGGFVNLLERGGYVEAGAWSTEAVLQYPDAVKQLHREFLKAGSDVMQTCTFFSTDDRLAGLGFHRDGVDKQITCEELNKSACDLARDVASEGAALVAGSISPTPGYEAGKGKVEVMGEFQKQIAIFKEKGADFLIGEFFLYVEEAEWAIQAMKQLDVPVACTMRLGPAGDAAKVPPKKCAVRMAKAGADLVGINCCFGPTIALETLKLIKDGLSAEGLSPHLMAQPAGWHTQDLRGDALGYVSLPEFPYAMEPRQITRMDAAKFAREAYDLGVRYIGGCCGFQPYHIRAMAQELAVERGKPRHDEYELLKKSPSKVARRHTREYWDNLIPATGRREVKFFAELDQSTRVHYDFN